MDEHRQRAVKIELPSGRVVSIRMLADTERPWEIQYRLGDAYTIVRRTRGDSSQQERLKHLGERRGGLVLTRGDAETLVAAQGSRLIQRGGQREWLEHS